MSDNGREVFMSSDVLLLDCYLDDGPGATPNFVRAMPGREVCSVRVARDPIPRDPEAYRAILISGSAASILDPPPWLDPLEEMIRRSVDHSVPLLGVCFGHQALSSALRGRESVFKRPQIELGWADIQCLKDDPLFDGLEEGFRTFVSHFDEVSAPESSSPLEVTARSGDCPTHGIRVKGKPAWGVQFHSEMAEEETRRLVRERAAQCEPPGPDPEQLLERAVDALPVFQRLIDNFLQRATEA